MQAASPPASPPPQSARQQQRARMPNKIQSHKRLLEEFSVVVVTGAPEVCAPCVVALAVVTGPGVVLLAIIPPATAKAAAPAIKPPTMAFLPGPGPGFGPGPGLGPGATVVSQGSPE